MSTFSQVYRKMIAQQNQSGSNDPKRDLMHYDEQLKQDQQAEMGSMIRSKFSDDIPDEQKWDDVKKDAIARETPDEQVSEIFKQLYFYALGEKCNLQQLAEMIVNIGNDETAKAYRKTVLQTLHTPQQKNQFIGHFDYFTQQKNSPFDSQRQFEEDQYELQHEQEWDHDAPKPIQVR